ncbi:MAG: hypothetical protein AB1705_19690 [Verrucomicrobiota bacterium]
MRATSRGRERRGYALILVMFFTAASLLLLSASLNWTSNSALQTHRNVDYQKNTAIAETATEKVISQITRDYLAEGEPEVYHNLPKYRSMVPDKKDGVEMVGYQFSDGQGGVNKTSVERITPWGFGDIDTKYKGLRGYFATYRVVSNARSLTTQGLSAMQQDLQLASIPIFQYGMFYASDLEFNPSASITFNGRVHSNGSIFNQPSRRTITYQSHVTAAKKILSERHPDDPVEGDEGYVKFLAEHDEGVKTLNLPLGTSPTPDALRSIVEIPPKSEKADSPMGQLRYYNKADLLILVENKATTASSGAYNNFASKLPPAVVSTFLNTNVTFFNKRENKEVEALEIDVTKFNAQLSVLAGYLGRIPRTLYVADLRSQNPHTQSGVRLINGRTLPTTGLTVATPNPLYVKGHYNAPSNLNSTNTTKAASASLVADAITILSGSWNDAKSGEELWMRRAASTTINAAMIGGIVATRDGYYSGGVENFHRLLEDWSGRTLTFNGAVVVLFESRIATAPWGATDEVYNPPTRKLSWDSRFKDEAKLPPATPEVRTVIRTEWTTVQPAKVQADAKPTR